MRIDVPSFPLVAAMLFASSTYAQPTFQSLGFLHEDDFGCHATVVARQGELVVGGACNVPDGQLHAFRWTAKSGMVDIGDLPGGAPMSYPTGISADGTAICGSSESANGPEAFRWDAEGMAPLGDLPGGGFNSSGGGISGDGVVVVGQAWSAEGIEAFRWTAEGGMVGLGDLNGPEFLSSASAASYDGSVIVGTDWSGPNEQAFRWTAVSGMVGLGVLNGALRSMASDVSADGDVVVGQSDVFGDPEAFRWTQATGMVGLGHLPGGGGTKAWGTSADGRVVVGAAYDDEFNADAFIWTEEEGLRGLRALLLELGVDDVEDWVLFAAYGVSDDGTLIVGEGINPTGRYEPWVAHLPIDCYPDLAADGKLDLFDFLAFVNLFNTNEPAADCDASGSLDIFDFLCFTNAFNEGC